MGSFTDYMVGKEDASLFLVNYYPRFSWLIDNLPENYMKQAVRRQITSPTAPTGLVAPPNVDRYFYGFTDADQLTFNLLWGSFDAEAARATATAAADEDGLGYSALDQTVGGLDLFRNEQRVFGISADLLVDVKVGFADPVANFETVVAGVNGEADTYPSMNENYRMLTERMDGHNVQILPNEAKNTWNIGTTAFARQFTYASERASLGQEVMVWESEPGEDEVRSKAEANSGIVSGLNGDIDSVEIDGRLVTVDYGPITNSSLYRGSGYTQD
ncbi:MAG: hypothetical protein ABEH77_00240 [Halobacteriaceae archaeon]